MPEVVGWSEALVSLYTGAGMTSAILSVAQSVNATFTRGWYNVEAVDGAYRDHLTGQRADVNIGRYWNYDGALMKLIESATAVHMKIVASAMGISAGYFLYSGRVASNGLAGASPSPYSFNLIYYANRWSGF